MVSLTRRCHVITRSTARTSYARGLPLSLFAKAPVLPNTVDADWKFREGVYEPGAGAGQAPDGAAQA